MYVNNFSAKKLGNKYSKNIILLRYEDFCLDPYGTVDKLINFLNYEPIPELIEQFLQAYTGKTRSGEQLEISKADHDDPMKFVKNSALKPFDWRGKINSSLLQNVEENCEKPMKELGYAKWNSDNEEILIKSAIEVWPFSK